MKKTRNKPSKLTEVHITIDALIFYVQHYITSLANGHPYSYSHFCQSTANVLPILFKIFLNIVCHVTQLLPFEVTLLLYLQN